MIKTELHTAKYQASDDSLVAVVWMPVFPNAPDIIIWNERCFGLKFGKGHKGRPVYTERFTFVAILEADDHDK